MVVTNFLPCLSANVGVGGGRGGTASSINTATTRLALITAGIIRGLLSGVVGCEGMGVYYRGKGVHSGTEGWCGGVDVG